MDVNSTIEALKKSLEESPTNIPLRLHLAKVYEDAGMHPQALDEYIKVGSIDEQNKEALLGAGRNLYHLKDYTAAIKQLLKVESAESFLYLVRCYLAVENNATAEEFYGKAKAAGARDEDVEKKLYAEKIQVSTGSDASGYEFEQDKPKIRFKDVGGLEKLKKDIELKIIAPYGKTHLFAAYGKKAGGGLLLYGPPGCGKTLIAKATAGEINATFMNLELSDILDMWRGQSEKKLHLFFEQARRFSPTVIFIDEVDALGASRAKFNSAEMKSLVNQLLTEMDGIKSDNSNILVIGATNTPWQLDSALCRPGRFDKSVFVPPPDLDSRIEIFRLNLEDKPKEAIDLRKLAAMTEGFSGADITQAVEQALENILPKAMEQDKVIPLTTKDIEDAIKETRSTTGEWFHTVRNYIDYANQTGTYNDVEKYMKEHGIL